MAAKKPSKSSAKPATKAKDLTPKKNPKGGLHVRKAGGNQQD